MAQVPWGVLVCDEQVGSPSLEKKSRHLLAVERKEASSLTFFFSLL